MAAEIKCSIEFAVSMETKLGYKKNQTHTQWIFIVISSKQYVPSVSVLRYNNGDSVVSSMCHSSFFVASYLISS